MNYFRYWYNFWMSIITRVNRFEKITSKTKDIVLTDFQKEYIKAMASSGLTAKEASEAVIPYALKPRTTKKKL